MASAPLQYNVRSALTELTLARIRELTREPEAVFWVFVFPIVLAAILSLAFRSRPPDPLPVGVVDGPQAAARMSALSDETGLRPRLLASEEAAQALARARRLPSCYKRWKHRYWMVRSIMYKMRSRMDPGLASC